MNQVTFLVIGSMAAMLLGTASGLEAFHARGGSRTVALAQALATILGAALTVYLAWSGIRGV